MKQFRYVEDTEDWLAPMDYEGFWYAVEPYELALPDKAHCDQQIRDGEAERGVILSVIKDMAQRDLSDRLGLGRRETTPWLQAV
ncbi:hypothetical protein ACFQ14_12620 [Pseudahrensia aquimaris]|uniref:Antitoxin HicB n=1 Tax=Pseudahrensia aquimaris TaxID=744461 RepID=A0ABW3FFI5_9HYPH